MSKLKEFLKRNTITSGRALPLIHSTQAYHLDSFRTSNKIEPRPCDVFDGEKLTYFFMGRPAYKHKPGDGQSECWEYPCCFIFEFESLKSLRRLFPFDSGAFAGKLYPAYTHMMDKAEFECELDIGSAEKIIGAFFGSAKDYFQMAPVGAKEFLSAHGLNAFDAEVTALHRLSTEKGATTFDDRRFTIEVQSASPLDLTEIAPLAVICPMDYLENADFRHHIVNVWQAIPLTYSVQALNVSMSYGQIYAKVYEFLDEKGYFL